MCVYFKGKKSHIHMCGLHLSVHGEGIRMSGKMKGALFFVLQHNVSLLHCYTRPCLPMHYSCNRTCVKFKNNNLLDPLEVGG